MHAELVKRTAIIWAMVKNINHGLKSQEIVPKSAGKKNCTTPLLVREMCMICTNI